MQDYFSISFLVNPMWIHGDKYLYICFSVFDRHILLIFMDFVLNKYMLGYLVLKDENCLNTIFPKNKIPATE